MRYVTAGLGRVLVVRLEDGDVVHEAIQEAARDAGVTRAAVILVGGADEGSTVVVGPQDGRASEIVPMEHVLGGAHEVAGVGTLFPDDEGRPVLHLHAAFGREAETVTGCVRRGVHTWLVLEAIVIELLGTEAFRHVEPGSGFGLLEVEG